MFKLIAERMGSERQVYEVYVNKMIYRKNFGTNYIYYIQVAGMPNQVKGFFASLLNKRAGLEISSVDDEDEDYVFHVGDFIGTVNGKYKIKTMRKEKAGDVEVAVSELYLKEANDDTALFLGKPGDADKFIKTAFAVAEVPYTDELKEKATETLSLALTESDNIAAEYLSIYGLENVAVLMRKNELRRILIEGVGIENGEKKSLKEFISKNALTLKKRVIERVKPLYSEEDRMKYQEMIAKLKRKPFKPQEKVAVATAKALQKQKGVFVVGEMGTGKTIMSIATTYLHLYKSLNNSPYGRRVVVMCPPHLQTKWAREIKETLGDKAVVVNISKMPISELLTYRNRKPERGKIEFWILGREQAKLHYKIVKNYLVGAKKNEEGELFYQCPDCGSVHTIRDIKKNGEKCPTCSTKLVSPETDKFRRYSKALLIKKYKNKFNIDLFIADEVHELKGGDTAQGQALACLATASKKVLALTGTLMGGYSSNLYYLLWRVAPKLMTDMNYKFEEVKRFVEKFGVTEEVIVEEHNNEHIASIGQKKSKRVREKPGISPVLIAKLLEYGIFIKLEDISSALPPYEEEVIFVEMEDEQAEEYVTLEETLVSEVRKSLARGSKALLGKMVQSLYAYPDGTRRGEIVYKDKLGEEIIAEASPVDIQVLPKEQKIIDIIQRESEQGRKVLVLLEHTGTRNLIPDLEERISVLGLNVEALYSDTVSPDKREEWIDKHECDVLITNPRIVQTGLDLYDYPTIVFFQTGYNVFTLRQASRRSWRIGQNQPVKVYYLAYKDTVQEKAMMLMAKKTQTSLIVEGELSEEGLTAISDTSDSVMMEIAKMILNGEKTDTKDVKEAWNKMREEELEAVSELAVDHNKKITETVEQTTTTTTTVNDKTVTTKFTVIANVKIGRKSATMKYHGSEYMLKKGYISQDKKIVGRYAWREKNGKKYAVCVLKNGSKVFYIGKMKNADGYVAIEKLA